METTTTPVIQVTIGPCEMRRSHVLGRYVVAKRAIQEGEIICQEYPILISPKYDPSLLWLMTDKNNNNNVCLTCFKKCEGVCRGCGWPSCGDSCGKAYLHSTFECKILREHQVQPMNFEWDFNAIETLRCLRLKDVEPEGWAKFMELEPNLEARANDRRIGECRDYVKGFLNRCKLQVDDADLEKVLGIISINSFSLMMNYSRHISAIFHNSALFAHSCDPNLDVIWGFHPDVKSNYDQRVFSLKFFATRDIEEGESLTHAYISKERGLFDRQEFLESNYYFKCDCSKCRLELFQEVLSKEYFALGDV